MGASVVHSQTLIWLFRKMMRPSSFFLVFFLILLVRGIKGQLRPYYYAQSCPSVPVEEIAKNITWGHVAKNPNVPAKLLRLFFHDCFVRGCDASILLDSTSTNTAEKDAFPNLSLEGYDVIDEIKTALDSACNGSVVSCADIVALAARDGIAYQFKESKWEVYTGRKDGKISLATDITANLPSPFSNFSTIYGQFKSKGLDLFDLVTLSGAHTIGTGHCFIILKRLYNFTGKGDMDPSLNSTYAETLKKKCPINSPINPKSSENIAAMDPGTPITFDNDYYKIVTQNEGLFQSDAALLTDPSARFLTEDMRDSPNDLFLLQFANSITKMGDIGVLTDGNSAGEVRKKCSVVNG